MKSKIINNTLVKFLAVGVLNTIIGAGTMFLLYNLVLAVIGGQLCCWRHHQLFPQQILYV